MGFTDTEITVSEDDGTVQVGLEVLLPAPDLISSSFTSANLIYRTDVFTANGSATGMNNSIVQLMSVVFKSKRMIVSVDVV